MKIKAYAIIIFCFIDTQNVWGDTLSSQIQQLQTQINQLQSTLNAKGMNSVGDGTSALVGLADPGLAYNLLQQQSQFPDVLNFGGNLGADFQAWDGTYLSRIVGEERYTQDGSAVALTSANLYNLVNLNEWSQAFIAIQGRLDGYKTVLSEAFVNFGNLTKTPLYATIGQSNIPFGTFPGNGLVATTLESNAFQANELPQINLGLGFSNFNTVLTVFNSESNLNDFAYALGYNRTFNQLTLSLGGGYMNDIRYTGADLAAAYGTSNNRFNTPTGILRGGRNGAVDLNADVTYNLTDTESIEGAAEWLTTTHSPTVAYTGIATGKLEAWTVTGSYTFPTWGRETTLALDYSATIHMQAVPLQLPFPIDQKSISAIGLKNQWIGYI